MTEILANLHLAFPEISILITACIVLFARLCPLTAKPSVLLTLSAVGILTALGFAVLSLNQYETLLFGQMFISDDLSCLMKIFILLTALLSFIYAQSYFTEQQMPLGDFYIIGLLSILGMMVIVSGYSLLSLYMGLELLSLPLYAMTAIRRNDSAGSEAAVKYFVMGALASGMILYGMSLLYGATGKLNLHDIANTIAVSWQANHSILAFALVFLVAGAGFKLAAVPFHMWAPDVYQGAPVPVTLFISAAPKIAGLGLMLRLLTVALADDVSQWQPVLIVMSLLSVILGNLLAIVQDNIKRLLAYSAISHTGFALFGIVAASPAGYSAALYYILVYALTSVAGFGLIVLMSREGMDIEKVDDLKGLNQRQPWLAFLFMLIMFSMAGVPPMVGFFTKLLVLKALVDVHLTWVAIVGLMFAVVGAYYYLRVVKVMYFDSPECTDKIEISTFSQVIFSANTLSLLLLGIFPGALVAMCIHVFAG